VRKTNSTNFENESQVMATCPIYRSTRLIAGRWRTHILWLLNERPMRFSEICHLIPLATERIVALRIRELMEDSLIEAFGGASGKSYRLTPEGDKLIPILQQLVELGTRRMNGHLPRSLAMTEAASL